jgi:hypothetical protein
MVMNARAERNTAGVVSRKLGIGASPYAFMVWGLFTLALGKK